MSSRLHRSLQRSLSQRERRGSLRSLRPQSSSVIAQDFSSNDYLDLSSSSALRKFFLENLDLQTNLASTGSRLLSGNSDLAATIEHEASTYWESPEALLCASGYEANVSIFSTLPQKEDTIIYDELIHASVHVGMKASRAARKIMMKHNDLAHLRHLLQLENTGNTTGNTFLAIETVYSMDGDLASLSEIINIIRAERPSTYLILDEAHATGVFGPSGQGLAAELNLSNAPEIFIRLHTLGKGAAGTGAIILCDATVKQYLLNYAKGLIYSTYMAIPALCLARAAIQLLPTTHNKLAKTRLWHNIRQFEALIKAMAPSDLLELPTSISSPIIPIISSRAVALSQHLEEHGFRVMPVRYPTVPRGRERLRICLRADTSLETLRELVSMIDAWARDETPQSEVVLANTSDFQSVQAKI